MGNDGELELWQEALLDAVESVIPSFVVGVVAGVVVNIGVSPGELARPGSDFAVSALIPVLAILPVLPIHIAIRKTRAPEENHMAWWFLGIGGGFALVVGGYLVFANI